MGQALSGLVGKLFGTREVRILMLGLDAAGKTTILYTLKLKDDKVTTIPTVGFNVETVNMKNVKFNVWDVGGQDKIRPLWRHYYSGKSCHLGPRGPQFLRLLSIISVLRITDTCSLVASHRHPRSYLRCGLGRSEPHR